MWPTSVEFSWDTEHLIFFALFYAVSIVLLASMVYAVARSIIDMFSDTDDDLLGHSEGPATDGESPGD